MGSFKIEKKNININSLRIGAILKLTAGGMSRTYSTVDKICHGNVKIK